MYENDWKSIEKIAGKNELESRAKSAIVANYLNAKSFGATIIKSIESEMIIDKVNGNHWNADENQYLTNSISTQSLIIEAFKTYKIETKSLVQWILHRYKQDTWQSTLSSNYALHSIISTSDFNKNTNEMFEKLKD